MGRATINYAKLRAGIQAYPAEQMSQIRSVSCFRLLPSGPRPPARPPASVEAPSLQRYMSGCRSTEHPGTENRPRGSACQSRTSSWQHRRRAGGSGTGTRCALACLQRARTALAPESFLASGKAPRARKARSSPVGEPRASLGKESEHPTPRTAPSLAKQRPEVAAAVGQGGEDFSTYGSAAEIFSPRRASRHRSALAVEGGGGGGDRTPPSSLAEGPGDELPSERPPRSPTFCPADRGRLQTAARGWATPEHLPAPSEPRNRAAGRGGSRQLCRPPGCMARSPAAPSCSCSRRRGARSLAGSLTNRPAGSSSSSFPRAAQLLWR